jgi:hypothetical protein
MRRIEKIGEVIVKSITFPLRMIIGICKAVEKNMPDTLEMPIEIKLKKEDNNANKTTS